MIMNLVCEGSWFDFVECIQSGEFVVLGYFMGHDFGVLPLPDDNGEGNN